MTEKVRGAWEFLAGVFATHPLIGTALVLVMGGGVFLDRHPTVLQMLLNSSAFGTVPAGWMLLFMALICAWIVVLSRRVADCQRNCEVESRALRTGIGRLILLIAEDRRDEATTVMREIDQALAQRSDLQDRSYSVDANGRRYYEGHGP